jgi:glycosyltransferase involved in cell wall biosynthesis
MYGKSDFQQHIEYLKIQKSIAPWSSFFPRCKIPLLQQYLAISMNEPLISVVIPNFNYDEYLENSINLILKSSIFDLEIVVVNSSDVPIRTKTQEVMSAYVGNKKVKFLQEQRQKAGENRNSGIRAASSKNIVCIDPDDWMNPQYLEVILFYAEIYDLDVCGAGMYVFGEVTNRWHTPLMPTMGMLSRRNGVPTNALFRKDAWKKAGGFYDVPGPDHIHEDWLFWHRLASLAQRIKNLDYPLTCIRIHGRNTSRADNVLPDSEQILRINRINKPIVENLSNKIKRTLNFWFWFRIRNKHLKHYALDVYSHRKIYSEVVVCQDNESVTDLLKENKTKNSPENGLTICNLDEHPNFCILPGLQVEVFNLVDLLPKKEWSSFILYLQISRGMTL